MARLLHRLGMLCARKPLVVIGVWFVLLFVVFGAVAKFGAHTNNDLSLPGTGSQEAKDLLQERFPPQQNGVNPIVFDVKPGKLTDDQYKQAIKDVRQGDQASSRTSTASPTRSAAPARPRACCRRTSRRRSPRCCWTSAPATSPRRSRSTSSTRPKPAQDAGITRSPRRHHRDHAVDRRSEISEIVGILAAMIILSLVLGSLVAMGMPILTAVARSRRRARAGRPARPPVRDPHQRPDAGHDDRARRRHRLRALPGHPTSGTATRRHADAGLDRERRGDLGQRDRLRRRHGRDRAAVAWRGRHPPGDSLGLASAMGVSWRCSARSPCCRRSSA